MYLFKLQYSKHKCVYTPIPILELCIKTNVYWQPPVIVDVNVVIDVKISRKQ